MANAVPRPFSERLSALLTQRGLKQAEVARRAGLRPSVLSRLCSGTRPPTEDHLVRIAAAFGLSLAELVAGTDAAEDRPLPGQGQGPDGAGGA